MVELNQVVENSLVATKQMDIMTMSDAFFQSGMFPDIKSAAQAMVKIVAGQELGIGPVSAMRGIDMVKGSIQLRGHLMAAMIKKSGKYNYRVTESTDERCSIVFVDLTSEGESGENQLGTSTFTMDDAKRAKIDIQYDRNGKQIYGAWQKHPSAMLYNRAMSQGARMYCPDIFLGPIYVEGEIEDTPATTSAPVVQMWKNPAEDVGNGQPPAFATENQSPVPNMGIPNYDDDDIPDLPRAEAWKHDPMTDNQRGAILGMLKSKGVRDGDKRELLAVVLGENPTKGSCSEHMDALKASYMLPPAWIGAYIKLLRDRQNLSRDYVANYMQGVAHVTAPSRLSRAQQLDLIDWLCQVHEPTTEETPEEVKQAVDTLFGSHTAENDDGIDPLDILEMWISSKEDDLDIPPASIEAYVLNRFGVKALREVNKEMVDELAGDNAINIDRDITSFLTN